MTLTPGELVTAEWYDGHAAEWMSTREDSSYWAPELAVFASGLAAGTEILEVGPGSGRDARTLIGQGFGYLGVDVSPGMLSLARERVPEGRFVIASPYQYNLGRSFAAWMAIASLGVHIPPARMGEALAALAVVLEPGAAGLITAKPSAAGTSYGRSDHDPVRMRTLWEPADLAETLEAAGFTVIRAMTKPPDPHRGGDRGWVSYLTRRT